MNMLNKLLGNVPTVYRGGGGNNDMMMYMMINQMQQQAKANAAMASASDIDKALGGGGDLARGEEGATLEEEDKARASVEQKKKGTRGLQIPLASTESTPTTTTPSAASTGVQI